MFLFIDHRIEVGSQRPLEGLGVAAGAMLTKHVYVQCGFSDANAQPTTAGFDTFLDEAEYFSYAEVGVTSSRDRIYLDSVHVTLWHTNSTLTPCGIPSLF